MSRTIPALGRLALRALEHEQDIEDAVYSALVRAAKRVRERIQTTTDIDHAIELATRRQLDRTAERSGIVDIDEAIRRAAHAGTTAS
jgi:hypothetical protein